MTIPPVNTPRVVGKVSQYDPNTVTVDAVADGIFFNVTLTLAAAKTAAATIQQAANEVEHRSKWEGRNDG